LFKKKILNNFVKKIYKGIWFYGLSGSGKTYASKVLNKKIGNSIIIDGDIVRKYISWDLGYSKPDREIQIKRVYGIGKIAIKSDIFPIISTVYFNNQLNLRCKKNKILVLKIVRENFEKIIKRNKTYKNNDNVVGKDIKLPKLKTYIIINNNKKNFILNDKIFKKTNII
tara:strand:+ start:10252 stop:10758 length:507 start_codon:yes stop_codon:yes gene_type:complete